MNTLWGNIFRKKPLIEALRETSLFKELSARELSILQEFLHFRTYHKDEVVFTEGEPGVGMYIVINGRIRITKNLEHGKNIDLTTLAGRGFFGEVSVIEGGPRTATAIAIEKAELLGFFKADMEHLIERKPLIAAKILFQIARILGERLRAMDEELSRVSDSKATTP